MMDDESWDRFASNKSDIFLPPKRAKKDKYVGTHSALPVKRNRCRWQNICPQELVSLPKGAYPEIAEVERQIVHGIVYRGAAR